MNKTLVQHVPAKSAVVRVIEPAQPEKFVVTLTRAQAMFLGACVGVTNDRDMADGWDLYQALPEGPRGSSFLDRDSLHALARACTKAATPPTNPDF